MRNFDLYHGSNFSDTARVDQCGETVVAWGITTGQFRSQINLGTLEPWNGRQAIYTCGPQTGTPFHESGSIVPICPIVLSVSSGYRFFMVLFHHWAGKRWNPDWVIRPAATIYILTDAGFLQWIVCGPHQSKWRALDFKVSTNARISKRIY